MDKFEYLTTKEAQVYTNLSRSALYKAKVLRSKTHEGKALFLRADLDEKFENIPRTLPSDSNIVSKSSKQTENTIPSFELTDDVQKMFDEIVERLGDNYHTIHNGVIESLLLIQHTKRFYHVKVLEDPISEWSKLLDQSIKQEASILKTLGLIP